MKRRDFITVLGGATAWAATAHAQEPRWVIGVLGSASYGAFPGAETAFIQGLKATGFIEGKNISIEWRWAEGQYNRLSLMAGELLSRGAGNSLSWRRPMQRDDYRREKDPTTHASKYRHETDRSYNDCT
jgi:hypothetical protein